MLPILYTFHFPYALIAWGAIIFLLIMTGSALQQSKRSAATVLVVGVVVLWILFDRLGMTSRSFTETTRMMDFPVYGYGFMLSGTFVAAATSLYLELKRKNMNVDDVGPATVLAVIFGLVGSRIFDAFESWDSLVRLFENPSRLFFGGSGLTFLGGFIMAAGAIFVYLRIRGVSIPKFCDANAPGLMIGYGLARVGCQLSGDGDYGIPTDLPWGMAYPHGTQPTREIVHPTPVYETLASCIIFGVLWKLRKRTAPDGWLFGWYLLLSGTARFLVEFIRLNPKWFLGLSQSQLISIALMVSGSVILFRQRERAVQPA